MQETQSRRYTDGAPLKTLSCLEGFGQCREKSTQGVFLLAMRRKRYAIDFQEAADSVALTRKRAFPQK